MQPSNSTLPLPDATQDYVSAGVLWIIALSIRVCFNSLSSLCGFVTNIINIVVFWSMGINDSATESFFFLSCADCLVSFIGVFAGVCNALRYAGPPNVMGSMYAIYILLLAAATVPTMTSMVSTAVIALVRSCSVALPLRVKWLLTARRQRIAILCPTAILLASLFYAMLGTRFEIVTNPRTNASYLAIRFHPEYVRRSQYADVFRGVMFYLSFFTVNVCLVVLIVALRRSSRFRKNTSRTSDEKHEPRGENTATGTTTIPKKRSLNTFSKEAKVIKVVILVSALFTICNLPAMAVSLLRQTIPELNNVGALRNTFDVIMIFVEGSLLLNTTLNIIVYFLFNTRYRSTFRGVFGKGNVVNPE